MINESLAIGADIGGTHITAAMVDLEKKTILADSMIRLKVDSHASSEEILDVWSEAILTAGKNYHSDKISLAIPGPFDYYKGICLIQNQDKYESLFGLNIKDLLAEKLHSKSENIILINDAASFLQGEAFSGAASGYGKALGVTLGTGLGTCMYEDHTSTNANLWNLPFKNGIAEDYLSTRWFISNYKETTGNTISGVRELSGLIDKDPKVKLIFREFGINLACFLKEFISVGLPEVIVIGGNISKSYLHFKEPLLEILNAQHPELVIKTAELGEEAALMGAASYWKYKGISLER